MTIEEKKGKLRNIIENQKSNPIDIALAILSATSANIDPKALGDILSPEQLASVKKQMEKYQNVYTYLDMDDDGNFVLKQRQKIVKDETIDKSILDPLTTCKFAKRVIDSDMQFIHANEYFPTSDLLREAEHRFKERIDSCIYRQIINNDIDDM